MFEQAGGPALRCDISPVQPALTFGFRFRTGYRVSLPSVQFTATEHRITIDVRVIPENSAPVFVTATQVLPNVASPKVEVVAGGTFEVGEGSYGISLMAVDDQDRSCRSSWHIQAHRTGSERDVAPTAAPGIVAEFSAVDVEPEDGKTVPRTGRLTVLLHAAPLAPNRPKLNPGEIAVLTESVGSLVRQWPAKSVRLIAFNLDQHSIVLRSDDFRASQMNELQSKLEQMDFAAVDYRVLKAGGKPIDLLAGLIQQEVQEAQHSDAILVVGPEARSGLQDAAKSGAKVTNAVPIFYLQYLPSRASVPAIPRPTAGPIDAMADVRMHAESPGAGLPQLPGIWNSPVGDHLQRLVGRFKGTTIPIRSPHDLAEAIHRIGSLGGGPAVNSPALAPARPDASPAVQQTLEPNEDADPVEVLARLRDRVLEHGLRIPNHTCVETVERSRFTATAQTPRTCDALLAGRRAGGSHLRLDTSDRLRLDVALTTEREIYSWAGANKFEEGEIDELVTQGAMGTGPFAVYLLSVFIGRPPRFVFEGEASFEGRTLYEYSFDVVKEESHFRFRAHHRDWMITGYSGRLFVDPRTSDLVRLMVRTEELPPETETCELDTTLDYGKVQLSSGVFLLPSSTKQRFIGRRGDEAENVYTFSACRDFKAESRIAFGDHTRDGSSELSRSAVSSDWTTGLPVAIEVTDTIDSATAAAGDVIEGRLAGPIRDRNGVTLAPSGAAVTGRLMRVEVRHPSPQVSIALRWETVELNGHDVPLALSPNRTVKRDSDFQFGGLAANSTLKRRGAEFELPLPGEERYAIFHFPRAHYVVDRGLRTEWVTMPR